MGDGSFHEVGAKTPANTPVSTSYHIHSRIGASLDHALAFGELAKALEAVGVSSGNASAISQADKSSSTTEVQTMTEVGTP